MKPFRVFSLALTCVSAVTLFTLTSALADPHIVAVGPKLEVAPELLLEDLRQAQVIFIGEFHRHEGHHRAQLEIIRALNDGGKPLAIGLEMFRRDSQDMLDRWSNGSLSLGDFRAVYEDNWSLWPLYRDIFLYAREEQVKMVGLNIQRELISRVALEGFGALSAEERQLLGKVECNVSSFYSDYISMAMGVHAGHGTQFLHFCEAQLLWDALLARNLVDFLKEYPNYRVVVLVGSAHAWKFGVPRKMLEYADVNFRVLLPEFPGRIDRSTVTEELTDYLWLDMGVDGWVF